jgi:hypothetical protein
MRLMSWQAISGSPYLIRVAAPVDGELALGPRRRVGAYDRPLFPARRKHFCGMLWIASFCQGKEQLRLS